MRFATSKRSGIEALAPRATLRGNGTERRFGQYPRIRGDGRTDWLVFRPSLRSASLGTSARHHRTNSGVTRVTSNTATQ